LSPVRFDDEVAALTTASKLLLAALTANVVVSVCTPTADVFETTTTSSTTTTSTASIITTTTVPATTTTSTTEPRLVCRPDPFTPGFTQQLTADYPGKQITAHVHDLRSNCGYGLNRENRQRTASVFKVMVMAGTLLEAQLEDRQVTEREMALLTSMITESANSPVRSLWRSFGAAPWFSRQGEIFGLRETTIRGDSGSSWGGTRTSALDQVNLIRQVLLGEWGPLEPGYRWIALDLMSSVVETQTWGITAGVPDDWTVAQKNGFAGSTINSVGWVDEPGPSQGYVVAILTHGWSTHARGIAATEMISETIAEVMTAPVSPSS